jgi:hypothetical protein
VAAVEKAGGSFEPTDRLSRPKTGASKGRSKGKTPKQQ